ncbi:MAG: SagB/ThcOx family dehydrogenase [Coprothermobacterota bacterium]|nr:SagB/ThcOx family dehydrogenase [Coprothermobacterota bacterium]
MTDSFTEQGRFFLKDSIRRQVDMRRTDQGRGVPPPPLEKPFSPEALRIDLTPPGSWRGITPIPVEQAITERESQRQFASLPLSLDELSFLLWSTAGLRKQVNQATALRTVPSAGSRHPLETYLGLLQVEGLKPGFYRYLPLEHQLLFLFQEERQEEKMTAAARGQGFVGQSAVTLYWVALPYRTEWRYGVASAKVIALDAGHICGQLYLSCQAIGAGTCGVAAYDQEATDQLLRLDGVEEFTVYLAPVGKTLHSARGQV